MEAYLRLETLEHTAKIIALSAASGRRAAAAARARWPSCCETRAELGFSRPGDAEEFCLACGVCHPTAHHCRPDRAAPAWDDTAASEEDRLVRLIADRVRPSCSGLN